MIEIRRILCPTDFSKASKRALERAVALAERFAASVHVLHVVPAGPLTVAAPGITAPVSTAPGPEEATTTAASELKRFVAGLEGKPVRIESEVSWGEPDRVIAERAASLPADIVVMGTHGHSRLERWVLGSVAEKVLRRAPCPVLTLQADGSAGAAVGRRLLCPIDFSGPSRHALRWALALGAGGSRDLDLLNVVEVPPEFPAVAVLGEMEELDRLHDRAKEDLRSVAEEVIAAEGVESPPRLRFETTRGKPHREITDVAAERDVDLIVMGSRGHGALEDAFFGSTAQQVVRSAPCPVLSVRPPSEEEA